jgi:hypothetical protein
LDKDDWHDEFGKKDKRFPKFKKRKTKADQIHEDIVRRDKKRSEKNRIKRILEDEEYDDL